MSLALNSPVSPPTVPTLAPWLLWLKSYKGVVLAVIIGLHTVALLALRDTAAPQTVAAVAPQEITVTLISPQPPAPVLPVAAPKPEPVPVSTPAPKPVPKKIVKPKPVVKPKPTPKPVPAPKAISQPEPEPEPRMAESAAEPAPAEPTAPAAAAAPAPAAAAAAAPGPALPSGPPKTITGVEYIQMPRPEYPSLSRRRGEEGKVILRVLVNQRGRPEQVSIQQSSGSSRLDQAAREAAMRAVFRPHQENGQPVPVYALVPINFSLD